MKIKVTGSSSYERETDGIVMESRIYSPPPEEAPEGKVWNGVLGRFIDEVEANYPFEVDEEDTVFGEGHLAQWGEGDELAAALEGEEEPKGKKSDKTAQDSLYEALVEDELPKDKTLAEHDKERHPDGFNPETDSCKFREEMKKETDADRADEIRPEPAPKEDGGEEGGQKKPLVSAEEDKAYMEAVERGDMETAAKMVQEVAGRAFPNTKVVDGDGMPQIQYHYGRLGIDHYLNYDDDNDPFIPKGPTHFGTRQAAADREVATSGAFDADEENSYGTTSYFLNIENPKETQDGWGKANDKTIGANVVHDGHDGNRYENVIEGKGSVSWVAYKPSQIKSADPVTWDDKGNVIPLSRRFDDGDDIRGDVSGKSNQQNPQPVEKSDFEKAIDEVTALRDKLSDSEKQREKALREEHDFDKAKALSQEQDELKKKIEKVRKKSEKLFREEAKKGMPNTKVLGKDGLPLIVYHGTVSGDRFTQFADRPIFAFHREGLAAQYTSPRRDLWVSPSRTGRVMPMVMNLENPYIVDAGRKLWNNLRVDWSSKPVDTDDVVEYAKKNGYDGVIIKQVRDNMFDNDRTAGDEYIAFKPSQVKDTGATYKRVMGYGLAGEYDEIVDVVGMTTDDQGNTIPMSRRFDSGNDIRGDVSSGTKSGEFGEDFFSSVYPDRKQSYSSEFGTDEGEEKAQAEEAYSANFTKDGEYKSPLEGGRFSKEILEKARG